MTKKIMELLNESVTNEYRVELRFEDEANMDMDLILTTKLTEVRMNEDTKYLYINAEGLQLKFKYKTCEMGTQSKVHNKFYFYSEEVSLTITIFM